MEEWFVRIVDSTGLSINRSINHIIIIVATVAIWYHDFRHCVCMDVLNTYLMFVFLTLQHKLHEGLKARVHNKCTLAESKCMVQSVLQ